MSRVFFCSTFLSNNLDKNPEDKFVKFWWQREIKKCSGKVLGTRISVQKDLSWRELWVKLSKVKKRVKLSLKVKKIVLLLQEVK